MRRKLERYAVLVFLVASPFWLPSLPKEPVGVLRLKLASLFQPAVVAVQSFQVGFRRLGVGLLQWPFLQEENRFLRKQVETLSAHEKVHGELSEENARLRGLLDLKVKSAWRFISAEVASREFSVWSRTLLIDKGSRQGIQSGMAVIVPAGLIGRVSEVGPYLSRVTLLNDPHFRVAVTASSSRVMGLMVGTASGEMLITYVPLEAHLKAGEMVSSSGGTSFCPGDVPIGMISAVIEDSSHLFQSARIRSLADLSAVEEVLVVIWPSTESAS